MKRKFFPLIIFFTLFFNFSSDASDVRAQPYRRIVSLKPNITEILFALGVGDQVVGVTKFCNSPKEANHLPKVADYIHVLTEDVLRLRPDLILGSEENSVGKEIQFLESRGLTVKLFPFNTIEKTLISIQELGELLGRPSVARQLTHNMQDEFQKMKETSKGFQKKRVLFVVGYHPLVVAGGRNFFDESSTYMGVTNVAGNSKLTYPHYSTETLIESAPEIIFDFSMDNDLNPSIQKERLDEWKKWTSIPAVRNNQIYFMNINEMRATPNLPKTLWKLFNIVHKDKSVAQVDGGGRLREKPLEPILSTRKNNR